MLRKTVLFIVLLLSIPLLSEAWFVTSTVTLSTSHLYPDDFGGQTLQEAIWNDTVKNGDTIVVRSGTYYEHLWVNKSITLEGFDRHTTLLDGSGNGSVIVLVADHVKIFEFTIQHGEPHGVYFGATVDGNVSRNIVVNNEKGVSLSGSSYCTLKDNDIKNNTYNFGVQGSVLEHYIHDIDDSNTISGKPVYYLVNQDGTPIPSNAGYVAVIHSSNILVENLQLPSNLQGVLIAYSTDVTVENLHLGNSLQGVLIAYSTDVTVENMAFEGNYGTVVSVENSASITVRDFELSYPLTDYEDGIYFTNTTNSVIENVTFSHHVLTGIPIYLLGSKNNLITNNKLTTKYVITTGIQLHHSDNNRIFDNVITKSTDDTGYGLGVHLSTSHTNTIVGNTISTYSISAAHYAIALDSSNETVVYHNNFLDDTNQIWSEDSFNTEWDNGLEGNYWKDYEGQDDGSDGRIAGDGIGDTAIPHLRSYPLYDPVESYPLMEPWSARKMFKRAMAKEKNSYYTMRLHTHSNSTLASFNFSRFDKEQIPPYNWSVYKGKISLRATCGYNGFLNITIPRNWLNGNFTVLIDEIEENYILTANLSHSSIYITFEQGSHMIKIIGTEAGNIVGDLNGDGIVDIGDVVIVTGNYKAAEEYEVTIHVQYSNGDPVDNTKVYVYDNIEEVGSGYTNNNGDYSIYLRATITGPRDYYAIADIPTGGQTSPYYFTVPDDTTVLITI